MKTNISIPADLYVKLYNKIIDYGFEPESEEETSCYMEIEIGKFRINLFANFDVNVVDESFSHEFGVEERWGLEVGELSEIEEVEVWYYDDETGYEANLTESFDENRFWGQFKRYGVVSKGVQIHYGDEVVVKYGMTFGAWTKMVYLYTDTRLGVHVCTESLHSRNKLAYKCILPATTGALEIVGIHNYYLHAKA